ncbi:MAG: hypothetical protein FJ290_02295 [Planctomycetes bacterium]|nr:hypothetical protein [Planctomycetota bacterium]
MAKEGIPREIRRQAEEIIERFNREEIQDPNHCYLPRFRGPHLYLDRRDHEAVSQIARLTFKGEIDNWGFAIFKYSSMRYDPHEWMFPGGGLVDGTIEGAMRAGLDAYPG